jgi:hypothetical protein
MNNENSQPITRAMIDAAMHRIIAAAKFPLGNVAITAGVARAFAPEEILPALADHARGKWGDICQEDKETNDRALENGDRLMSTYTRTEDGERLWVITEWDRSLTTCLLPDEY